MKPRVELELDEQQQRMNYRVKPAVDDRVTLTIQGNQVRIINLSVQGVAFFYTGPLEGPDYPAELHFTTDKAYSIATTIHLIRRQPPEFSGEFIDISEREASQISTLIMECQKRAIRRKRQQSKNKL